ncbi:MAG: restriction endonuclease, partial [Blastocatellia bacterium]
MIALQQLMRTPGGWLFLIAVATLAVAVTFLRKIYPVWRRSEANRALRLADVDNLSGEQFERYVNELLKAQGYRTEMTPARNDYGVDIVAERGGVSYAVQCKRHGENISRGAVSDAV